MKIFMYFPMKDRKQIALFPLNWQGLLNLQN